MADGQDLKPDNRLELAEDDPMAELTRIMGLDTPSGHPAFSPVSVPVADDYAIDLEQEMLGDMALSVSEAPVSTQQVFARVHEEYDEVLAGMDAVNAAPVAADPDFDSEFADVFEKDIAADEPVVPEAPEAVFEAPEEIFDVPELMAEQPVSTRPAVMSSHPGDDDIAELVFGSAEDEVREEDVPAGMPSFTGSGAEAPAFAVAHLREPSIEDELEALLNNTASQQDDAESRSAMVAGPDVAEAFETISSGDDAQAIALEETVAAVGVTDQVDPVWQLSSARHEPETYDGDREYLADPVDAGDPALEQKIDDLGDLPEFDEVDFLDTALLEEDISLDAQDVASLSGGDAVVPDVETDSDLASAIAAANAETSSFGMKYAAPAGPRADMADFDSIIESMAREEAEASGGFVVDSDDVIAPAEEAARDNGHVWETLTSAGGIAVATQNAWARATPKAVRSIVEPSTGSVSHDPVPAEALQAAPVAERTHDMGVPDIETVDLDSGAVEATDELDLPQVDFAEDAPAAVQDIEAELTTMLHGDTAADAVEPAAPNIDFEDYFAKELYSDGYGEKNPGSDWSNQDEALPSVVMRPAPAIPLSEADIDDDGGFPELTHVRDEAPPARRGMMVAAIVAGIALLGGIAAFALSGGGSEKLASGEDGVAIVKADPEPVKVKPENPGGAEIKNADSKVYEQVAGKAAVDQAPEQKKLVSESVEPADIAKPETQATDLAAGGKSEDRIDPVSTEQAPGQSQELSGVSPRMVKTMIVRPDGTLVERQVPAKEPAPAPVKIVPEATPAPVEVAKAEVDPVKAPEPAQAAPEVQSGGGTQDTPAVAAKPVKIQTIKKPETKKAVAPEAVPVAPPRPAEQPVNIIGTTRKTEAAKPVETASLPEMAGNQAKPGAAWVQISSQPSRELAQASYANATRKFGKIISGRGVNIQQADIPGKGTYYRVNIPAGNWAEANALCQKIKAAGGACLPKK